MTRARSRTPGEADYRFDGAPRAHRSHRAGSLELRNRIAIAPMRRYPVEGGRVSDWRVIRRSLSLPGAELLIVEATAATPEGGINSAGLGL